jgi:hypothetical protein
VLCSIRASLMLSVIAAAVLALAGSPARAQAPDRPVNPFPLQPPSFPSVTQPTQQTQVSGRPTAPPASYAPPPVNPQMYAPSYAPYYGQPYWNYGGGALTGAANVINAQGEFEKQYQESRLLGQEVERSKIDTRRKQWEQWQYERANKPTVEDERRRSQYEQVRRSVNDPPLNEIWDGSALNTLFTTIKQAQASGLPPGPSIPLDPNLVARIGLTTGTTNNGVGMLKNGPNLRWPFGLSDDSFDADKKDVQRLLQTAYDQVSGGAVDGKVLRDLYKKLDDMETALKEKIEDMTPTQNVQANRYLRELRETVRVFEQPDAQGLFAADRTAPARTVGELVQNMTAKGQKFAPALAGAEPAYTALHSAMVAYYIGLTQPAVR